jgi:hypothetical protein
MGDPENSHPLEERTGGVRSPTIRKAKQRKCQAERERSIARADGGLVSH